MRDRFLRFTLSDRIEHVAQVVVAADRPAAQLVHVQSQFLLDAHDFHTP